jgi:dsRNA-specific ribonuclease
MRAAMVKTDDEIRELREHAWVGDAVLALYAREWVLRERAAMDGEWFTRMTSNDFLSCFGNPTAVEARIGALYRERGLAAAFAWIEAELVPLFRKRMAARTVRG